MGMKPDNKPTVIICASIFLFSTIIPAQDFGELEFGTDSTFEIMTWNIEWFPKNGQSTVDYVTEIIQALDIDLLAIQEVDNTEFFDQMILVKPGFLQKIHPNFQKTNSSAMWIISFVWLQDMIVNQKYGMLAPHHRDYSDLRMVAITGNLLRDSTIIQTGRNGHQIAPKDTQKYLNSILFLLILWIRNIFT